MAEGQYCIVDVTVDPNTPIDGLTGFTLEAATEWLNENQVLLDAELVIGDQSFINKYLIQPDNWPVPTEE